MSPCRPWVRADDGPVTDSWARGFHLKDPTIQYIHQLLLASSLPFVFIQTLAMINFISRYPSFRPSYPPCQISISDLRMKPSC